jgi:hypothetical protein
MDVRWAEQRGIVTVNLTRYYAEKRCPSCAERLSRNKHASLRYDKIYLRNARKQFGRHSLPVCFECWTNYCQLCECCLIPLDLCSQWSAKMIGRLILDSTTLVSEQTDDKCETCVLTGAVEAPVSDGSDSDR